MEHKTYTKMELALMKPLVLAYIGDSIYEVYIRELLIREPYRDVNDLHKRAVRYVKAATQAKIVKVLEPLLTEEESDVVRRGRNAHSHTVAKNADVCDYRYATGFEALIGYLYLSGDRERLLFVLENAAATGLELYAGTEVVQERQPEEEQLNGPAKAGNGTGKRTDGGN